MGTVGTVCIRYVLTLHRMRVESRVFYTKISQRSGHVKHSTCNQNVAIHSMFNIQDIQAAFSPLYCTVSKFILHGKSAYSVHTVCSCIAQNVRWITCVSFNDIAAILSCKALYVQPNCSHTPYVQYTRVLRGFFTIIMYCKQVYFTSSCHIAILPCTALYLQP